jgi:hypothetical protein
VSFLNPDPPPRPLMFVTGAMIAVCIAVLLDGFGIIDLHGLGLPLIACLTIVAMLVQTRLRRREHEADRG